MSTDGADRATGPVEPGERWYADGLAFDCSQCGNCCTGPPGAVWFEPEEGRAMAETLGLDEAEFLRTHTRAIGRRRSLVEVERDGQFDCVFLERDPVSGRTGCRVYRARPTQCRTWPYWPENLATPESWAAAKASTPCRGMDQGPVAPLQQIRIIRNEQAEADARIRRG